MTVFQRLGYVVAAVVLCYAAGHGLWHLAQWAVG